MHNGKVLNLIDLPETVSIKRIDVPLKSGTPGYMPTQLNISLTPTEAQTLADVAEGYRAAGANLPHHADGINAILQAIADES